MTDGENIPGAMVAIRRRARLFRIAAIVVLLLGAAGVGLVYWRGKRSVDLSDDASMMGYDKGRARQMQMYYGNQGLVLNQLMDALQKPNTQAALIVVAAGLLAAGCFHVAHLLEFDARRTGGHAAQEAEQE
jgi:hypothetical protein